MVYAKRNEHGMCIISWTKPSGESEECIQKTEVSTSIRKGSVHITVKYVDEKGRTLVAHGEIVGREVRVVSVVVASKGELVDITKKLEKTLTIHHFIGTTAMIERMWADLERSGAW